MAAYVSANNSAELADIIAKAKEENKIIVMDFWAAWCGPCRLIAPVFEKLASDFSSQAIFVKVDVEKGQDISKEYAVRAMPTFIVLKDGAKVDELVGASKEKLEAMVRKNVAAL